MRHDNGVIALPWFPKLILKYESALAWPDLIKHKSDLYTMALYEIISYRGWQVLNTSPSSMLALAIII